MLKQFSQREEMCHNVPQIIHDSGIINDFLNSYLSSFVYFQSFYHKHGKNKQCHLETGEFIFKIYLRVYFYTMLLSIVKLYKTDQKKYIYS